KGSGTLSLFFPATPPIQVAVFFLVSCSGSAGFDKRQCISKLTVSQPSLFAPHLWLPDGVARMPEVVKRWEAARQLAHRQRPIWEDRRSVVEVMAVVAGEWWLRRLEGQLGSGEAVHQHNVWGPPRMNVAR